MVRALSAKFKVEFEKSFNEEKKIPRDADMLSHCVRFALSRAWCEHLLYRSDRSKIIASRSIYGRAEGSNRSREARASTHSLGGINGADTVVLGRER
jgi:hypothetical protein